MRIAEQCLAKLAAMPSGAVMLHDSRFALPFPGYAPSMRVLSVHVKTDGALTGNANARKRNPQPRFFILRQQHSSYTLSQKLWIGSCQLPNLLRQGLYW